MQVGAGTTRTGDGLVGPFLPKSITGDDKVWLLLWFIAALGVRVLVHYAAILWSFSSNMGGFFPLASGGDDRFYYQTAVDIASGDPVDLSTLPNAYPIFLGWVYILTTPSLFLGQTVNVLVGALSVLIAVCIAKELTITSRYAFRDIRHPVNLTGLMASLYPGHVFYSTQLLKDPILDFLGLVGIYLAILAFRRKGSHAMMLWGAWIIILVILYFWRGYTVYALVAAVVCFFFMSLRTNSLFKAGFIIMSAVLIGTLPYLAGYGWFASEKVVVFLEHMSDFRKEVYSIGGSAVGIVLDPRQPFQFAIGWLYSFMTVWLGPFPWQIRSAVHLIALPEAIMMWVLVPFVLRAVWQMRKSPGDRSHLLLLFSVILMAGIGLFSDNVGANTRLRLLPWMTLMIYAVVKAGASRRRAYSENSLPHHPQRAGRGANPCVGFDSRVPGSG